MNLLKKILNKRKQKRYITHGHAYLVVQPYTTDEKKIHIIDISKGGCAFIYQGGRYDFEDNALANLVTGDCLHVEKIKFATKSDVLIAPNTHRRGVEFTWLGEMDKKRIADFIVSSALCPCP